MATLNENVQTIQLFALLFLLASLWKSPLGWRFLRQSQGGIIHRLRAILCYRIFLVDTWILRRLLRFLQFIGVPVRLLNLISSPLPRSILRAGARVYMERHSLEKASQS